MLNLSQAAAAAQHQDGFVWFIIVFIVAMFAIVYFFKKIWGDNLLIRNLQKGIDKKVTKETSEERNALQEDVMPITCNGTRTTNTGYSNEKAIAGYADVIFICATVGCVALYIAVIFLITRFVDSTEAIVGVSVFGGIITAIYIVLFYIAKAFIKIYANISINLHEINMKLK